MTWSLTGPFRPAECVHARHLHGHSLDALATWSRPRIATARVEQIIRRRWGRARGGVGVGGGAGEHLGKYGGSGHGHLVPIYLLVTAIGLLCCVALVAIIGRTGSRMVARLLVRRRRPFNNNDDCDAVVPADASVCDGAFAYESRYGGSISQMLRQLLRPIGDCST